MWVMFIISTTEKKLRRQKLLPINRNLNITQTGLTRQQGWVWSSDWRISSELISPLQLLFAWPNDCHLYKFPPLQIKHRLAPERGPQMKGWSRICMLPSHLTVMVCPSKTNNNKNRGGGNEIEKRWKGNNFLRCVDSEVHVPIVSGWGTWTSHSKCFYIPQSECGGDTFRLGPSSLSPFPAAVWRPRIGH